MIFIRLDRAVVRTGHRRIERAPLDVPPVAILAGGWGWGSGVYGGGGGGGGALLTLSG